LELHICGAQSLDAPDHVEVLINCQFVPDQVVLSTQAKSLPVFLTVEVSYGLPEDHGLSRRPLMLHGKNRECGGLASAIRSEQAKHLVPTYPERIASDGRKDPNCVVLFVEIVHFHYEGPVPSGSDNLSFLLEHIVIRWQGEDCLRVSREAIVIAELALMQEVDQEGDQEEDCSPDNHS
jgi:hypothetical protein